MSAPGAAFTPRERAALDALANAFAAFAAAGPWSEEDRRDALSAIHRLQDLVSARLASRVEPGFLRPFLEPRP